MEKTKCKTYFEINGDFNVEEITKILGIGCTYSHSIGQKKEYTTGTYDWAAWRLGTEYEETLEADEQIEKVIEPLNSKIDELLDILNKYKCNFIIYQVPIINNGETPALIFNKKIIDFCYKTNTKIEIDLYINNRD